MTTRPVFGQVEPPPASKERMAYIARAGCGHIVIAQADSRVPSEQVRTEGFCTCPRPVQIGAGL